MGWIFFILKPVLYWVQEEELFTYKLYDIYIYKNLHVTSMVGSHIVFRESCHNLMSFDLLEGILQEMDKAHW